MWIEICFFFLIIKVYWQNVSEVDLNVKKKEKKIYDTKNFMLQWNEFSSDIHFFLLYK